MEKHQQERAKVLLKATLDILNECDKGSYMKNVMEVTAIWDEAECDGSCLRDEINQLIIEIEPFVCHRNKPNCYSGVCENCGETHPAK